MVYQFCKALSWGESHLETDNLLDLVAMGQIGDASDVADYEIRHLVRRGLENITSPLLKKCSKRKLSNGSNCSKKTYHSQLFQWLTQSHVLETRMTN